MLNLVIPMAGAGKRFAEVGYTFPKPLISVHNKPIIQVVFENLKMMAGSIPFRPIFIVQKEHHDKFHLNYLLNLLAPGCIIVQTDGVTAGAACTVLLAKEYINSTEPLLMCDSDQIVKWNLPYFVKQMCQHDGGIVTFTSMHPKLSFCELDSEGYIVRTVEKTPISNVATCGIYFWTAGKDFVDCAESMVAQNKRTNNEFYVAPVYNEGIARGLKFKTFPVDEMWSLGTPEDFDQYLATHNTDRYSAEEALEEIMRLYGFPDDSFRLEPLWGILERYRKTR